MIDVTRAESFADASALLLSFLRDIGEPEPDPDDLRRLAKAVQAERIHFFVARSDDECVGLCSLSIAFSTYKAAPIGLMDDVYVAEAWRGRGVTRALLEALTRHASLKGCRSVLLGCGPEGVGMWRHLGFKPLGTLMATDVQGRE